MRRALIVGCGPSGLGAATQLERDSVDFELIDRDSGAGGLARTDQLGAFRFDRTGHFLHMRSDEFRSVVERTGVPLDRIQRKSCVALHGRIVPFPIQYNLWAVDESIRNAALGEIGRSNEAGSCGQESLKQAMNEAWGPTLLREFFEPYNEKLLGHLLEDIPADCLGRFAPRIDVGLVKRGAHEQVLGTGYNAEFHYPASGSIGELFNAIAERHRQSIRFGERLLRIDTESRCAQTDRRRIEFDFLVSSQPLPELLRACGIDPPASVRFRSAKVRNVRVGFRGSMLRDEHWVYVPDKGQPFYRIGFPRNINVATCPDGTASLSIECGCAVDDRGYRSTQEVAESAVAYCSALGFVKCSEMLCIDELSIDPAYVIDRSEGRRDFQDAFDCLAAHGIFATGRYGRWDYLSMEDSFLDGMTIARSALALRRAT